MKTLLLCILCIPAFGEDFSDTFMKASFVALPMSSAFDAASSWGKVEANPLLGSGRFGARQAIIKVPLVAGPLVTESLISRKSRKTKILIGLVNFGTAGVFGWAAAHNMGER